MMPRASHPHISDALLKGPIMREIDVHDFHRRVVINGEPALAGLREAAAAISGNARGAMFGDWGVWSKIR
jgi:hypothetical protein